MSKKYLGLLTFKDFLVELQKILLTKQSTMEEMGSEELIIMWTDENGNEVDLSWVATKEQVNTLITKVDDVVKKLNTAVAADIEGANWRYKVNGTSKVTLYQYIGSDKNTIIPSILIIDGSSHATLIDDDGMSGSNYYEGFYNNSYVETIDIPNVVKYVKLSSFFNNCKNLKQITGLKNLVPNSASDDNDLSWMFSSLPLVESIDLRGFDISKAKKMSYMFNNCPNLKEVLVDSTWVIPSACANNKLFSGCGCSEVTFVEE